MPSRARPAVAVAGVSAAILLLEILLTRVFSVTLAHHFAFIAISVGMLGLAAAGVHVSLGGRRFPAERASAAASPCSRSDGTPSSSRTTSIWAKGMRDMPAPSAFIAASLAANRAARCGVGSRWRHE